MKPGAVFLVGSGPGDPGLLTLKAKDRISRADLIVYDYLANPEHLRHARADARRICVGKGFRHKAIGQERINRMIVRAARAGRQVVRLKGGDPYLFGRGGEEALYLQRHGIRFEVIPGVTSATACAAYAGIPLTHRDHNAAVTFLTGHRADDEKLDTIAWERIVGLGGTIVIYMGFYNLGRIAQRLIGKGLAPSTPAAVIEWGTLPRQRVCEGPLSRIASIVRRRGLGAPCMILIGDVVRLRRRLRWYERLPLFGKRVVVTRPLDQSPVLADRLQELGAEIIELPTIRIEPPADKRALDRSLAGVSPGDWAVFLSAHGVQGFFERIAAIGRDARVLAGVSVACVGPETGRALRRYGIEPDLQPPHYESSELLRSLGRRKGIKGKRVWLFRTDIADGSFEAGLRRLGARPRPVVTYRTRTAKPERTALERVRAGEADVVTFTSASTARAFASLVGAAKARALSRKTLFASIGPVTSRQMRRLGMRVGCQAGSFTIDGLVAAVKNRSHHGLS